MSTSLSSLVDNLSDGFHCNKGIDCKSSLDYMITRDDQLIISCFECKKNYQKGFNKDLTNRSANTYEFCNKDINRFILLLRKGIDPHEYIDCRERIDKKSLPVKEAFYSSLVMEGITSVDIGMRREYIKNLNKKTQVIIMTCMFKVIHYCLQVFLKTFETSPLKYLSLILFIFCLHQGQHGRVA